MTATAAPPRPARVPAPSKVSRARSGPSKRRQPYNASPAPIYRCHFCNYWVPRKVEGDAPACPWCTPPRSNGSPNLSKQVLMFATIRNEPAPSPALGSVFEDL